MAIQRISCIRGDALISDKDGELITYDDHLAALREMREGIAGVVHDTLAENEDLSHSLMKRVDDAIRAYGLEGEEEKP